MKNKSKEELIQAFRIQAIRDAASRVVAARGIDGATIEAIAEEAGIAKGTIYLYFANREDLLEKAAEHALELLNEQIEQALAPSASFREQLGRFVGCMLSFFDDNREFFRLYRAAGEKAQERGEYCHPGYLSYFQRLSAWVAAAMEKGQARSLDAERVALALSEMLHGVIRRRLVEETSPPVEQEAAWLTTVLLDGLVPAPSAGTGNAAD